MVLILNMKVMVIHIWKLYHYKLSWGNWKTLDRDIKELKIIRIHGKCCDIRITFWIWKKQNSKIVETKCFFKTLITVTLET